MTTAAISAAETRRVLAEKIRVTANIRSPRIVDATASVPGDTFLPAGPWTICGIVDVFERANRTCQSVE